MNKNYRSQIQTARLLKTSSLDFTSTEHFKPNQTTKCYSFLVKFQVDFLFMLGLCQNDTSIDSLLPFE